MKKAFTFGAVVIMGILAVSCPSPGSRRTTTSPSPSPSITPPPAGSFTVQLVFQGPSVSPGVVYAAWIEDESGNNLQNVYICNRVLSINPSTGAIWQDRNTYGLKGDGIPNWLLKKYSTNNVIDGITGASAQQNKTMSVTLNIGSVTRFRVCFEIDRSNNGNTNFWKDRPAFTYKSSVIDLAAITTAAPATANLGIDGWMSNHTGDGDPFTQYSQQPIKSDGVTVPSIPGYAPDTYMTDLSWIQPDTDMVTSLTATITKN